MRKILTASMLVSVLMSSTALASAPNPDAYSPQNLLINDSPAIQASANNGAGITFGVIDTGGTKSWSGFQGYNGTNNEGRIIVSTCVGAATCPISSYVAGNTDDNGHGTFVTSELIGGLPNIGLVGVAPAANVIEVKVLNAQGSGSTADIAQGIITAVNMGAQVLNLSIGPMGTGPQQAAFYQGLASAINYAASKNAIVVMAGGNNAQVFAGGFAVTGYTNAALSHLFFMGSTNVHEQISSFSNTPGTGGFLSTTYKYVPFDTMWLVADGENIWGASNYSTSGVGYNYITQMSGTSMAAPQGAGAAGLLAARWPFLLAQGTIPAILEATGNDLGNKGVDTTYGEGFLNVAQAMQPVGTLSVPVNGKMVAVSNASASQISSGGAMGNMAHVSSALSSAVAYDAFMRGFPLYGSSPVVTKSSTQPTSAATQSVSGQKGATSRSFTSTGGNNWAFSSGEAPSSVGVAADYSQEGLAPDPSHPQSTEWSYGYSNNGNYVGYGQGSGAALSFNDARWNGQSAFIDSDAGGSNALLGTVAGAHFATAGFAIGEGQRIAMSVVNATEDTFGPTNGAPASVRGSAFAYTMQPTESWQVSFTSSFINESNMLLGSTANGSMLGFGSSSDTMSFGVGTNVDLGDGYQVGFDAAYASTGATGNSNSLIGGTSRLESSSFNLAVAKDDVTGVGDRLGVSLNKPLRVFSGSANVSIPTGTDDNANPIIQNQRVSLAPTGSETDLGVTYNRPLAKDLLGSLNFLYRNDADNVSGVQDAAAMLHVKYSF